MHPFSTVLRIVKGIEILTIIADYTLYVLVKGGDDAQRLWGIATNVH